MRREEPELKGERSFDVYMTDEKRRSYLILNTHIRVTMSAADASDAASEHSEHPTD